MLKTVRATVLALACVTAGAAVAQTGSSASTADDVVVARVNGSEIRRSEVLATIEALPEQYRQLPMEMLFSGLVQQMIDQKLLAQAAEKSKLQDDAEVQKRISAARERVLQEIYLTREVEKGLTDEKLRARYEQTMREQPAQEEVKARHILVASEGEAKALIEELNKGTDFVELAKKSSTGPSAATGGDLGYFTKDQMVPEFAEAAFGLQKGEVTTNPVKTQFGWHVIKVEDRREAPRPSFEESAEELRREMAQELIGNTLEDLRKTAKIEQYNADGSPAAPAPKQQ